MFPESPVEMSCAICCANKEQFGRHKEDLVSGACSAQGKDMGSTAVSISSLSITNSQLELHPVGLALSPSLGTGSTLF